METKCCENCKNFHRHYGLGELGLIRLSCGHCGIVRLRYKKAYHKACEHFEPGENPEDSFVRKDYLTKALLERVLKMDLLPEIRKEAEE